MEQPLSLPDRMPMHPARMVQEEKDREVAVPPEGEAEAEQKLAVVAVEQALKEMASMEKLEAEAVERLTMAVLAGVPTGLQAVVLEVLVAVEAAPLREEAEVVSAEAGAVKVTIS